MEKCRSENKYFNHTTQSTITHVCNNNYKASILPQAHGFGLVTPDPFLMRVLGVGKTPDSFLMRVLGVGRIPDPFLRVLGVGKTPDPFLVRVLGVGKIPDPFL